ncbi:subtilase-type protease inhibitor [Streptomyces sp. enrichment culture]|uniref:SSI family serine proteinase inhibitor n=1 Tax=Streptomyces sp. enrichment culture TaxID=1795815 RepID=UPI003F57AC7F
MTHTSVKTVGAGLSAAALLLLAGATPSAHADTGNWLMLSVSHGETQVAGTEGGTLLRCDPPGGGHPHAEEACAQLSAADGRIAALPAEDVLCPMIYAPVTAHAEGMWRDRPVTWTETFPNACTLRARTGALFALDGT